MVQLSNQSATLEIRNKRGLHARASARFVETAARYDADVRVSKDGMEVIGTSIMGLMLLAASKGDTIHLNVTGQDAAAALDALRTLIAARFDED
ncbi:MAG: HPr family phosphocarrier protein [Pseudomonadota bacterium]